MGQPTAEHHLPIQEQLTHDQAHDLLYAYAHECLMSASHTSYPTLIAHLAECEMCRADVQELMELMEIGVTTSLTASADYPILDRLKLLRFWQQRISASHPQFIDCFKQLWLELSQQVLQSWGLRHCWGRRAAHCSTRMLKMRCRMILIKEYR